MTTLITGGAGFIGSNFVELLFNREPADEIYCLDVLSYASHPDNIPTEIKLSPRFHLVIGDICDRQLVSRLFQDIQVDRVVHFAAESHVTRSISDDRPFFQTDVMGTQSVVDAVARSSKIKRFVHISTSEVYGTAIQDPMTEDHPLNPCTPYAAAKAGADRLVYAYRKTYGIPAVIIRPFNNYGPKQHLEKLVPRLITQALCNEPLSIHGDGLMTRDWVYVSDTCEAVYRALVTQDIEGNIINVGTGIDTSVIDVAKAVLAKTGRSPELIRHGSPRPGQVDRHISSTSLSEGLLGWRAKIPFDEGLSRTVAWYDRNRNWWQRHRGIAEISIEDPTRRLSGSY